MATELDGSDQQEIEPDPATWTAFEEKIFIQLMVNEARKGNRSSTTFSKEGWRSIGLAFFERTNKRHSSSQFRNKFNQLRRRFNEFSELLKEPGFSWDPALNMVHASDAVWESYVRDNKKARRFRKKGCPMFAELGILFDDLATDYKQVFPLAQYPMVNHFKMEDEEDESTNDTPSASSGRDFLAQNNSRRRARSPTPTSHHRVKRGARAAMASETFNEGTGATVPSGTSDRIHVEIPKLATSNFQRIEKSSQGSPFSITNCVQCLEAIEGVDATTYIKAIKMFKDVDWREMFMAMSPKRRLVWLASLD